MARLRWWATRRDWNYSELDSSSEQSLGRCQLGNNIVLIVENYYSKMRHCRLAVYWVGDWQRETRLRCSDYSRAPGTAVNPRYKVYSTLRPLENAMKLMLVDGARLGVRLKTSLPAPKRRPVKSVWCCWRITLARKCCTAGLLML